MCRGGAKAGDAMTVGMPGRSHNPAHHELKSIIGSLRTVETRGVPASQAALPEWPFVTISRQGGSGAMRVGNLLAAHLNESETQYPWQCLDRGLVERIAADHHLSTELIESLETSSHSWVGEFVEGLRLADGGTPSELAVFRRAAETMRGLARAGHVILVGLGGVMITRGMPRGIHVRIVAPLEWRIQKMAAGEQISEKAARERVKTLDQNRQAFFRKFWPHESLTSELFHVTFNASMMTEEMMARALVPLVAVQQVQAVHT